MHAVLRTIILGLATALAAPAGAGEGLDDTVRNHVLARFDAEARALMQDLGARPVASRWDGAGRTLIAVGELAGPASWRNVAYPRSPATDRGYLERHHLERLCRHPALALIAGFLEEHDISLSFVYTRGPAHQAPLVVDIDHSDLAACT